MCTIKINNTVVIKKLNQDLIKLGFKEKKTYMVLGLINDFVDLNGHWVDCDNVKKINLDYLASNRYKLAEKIESTGISYRVLSRAANRNQDYFATETKEFAFKKHGDMSDKRYNELLKDVLFAEKKVLGIGDDKESTIKESTIEESEVIEVLDDIIQDAETKWKAEDLKITQDDVVQVHREIIQSKRKPKTQVKKSYVWLILFVIFVFILLIMVGIYKSIF